MIDRLVPASVRDAILTPRRIESACRVPSGMSGAVLFFCRDQTGTPFALRRWPKGTSQERVEEVRSVVAIVRESGCELVPRLYAASTRQAMNSSPESHIAAEGMFAPGWISASSYHWELSQWMPGRPLPADAGAEQIRRGAQAIAHFHRHARVLGVTRQSPPAVAARIGRAKELDGLLPQAFAKLPVELASSELTSAINEACWLLREKWGEVGREITRSLSRYERVRVETQYVLRDVHRQHILFEHDTVTGLIDFDAIRVDTPMTDLARWIGSFAATEEVWEFALAGYFEGSPSPEGGNRVAEARLAREIGRASTWISLSNWVVWVVLEKLSSPLGPDHVARRIAELIRFARRDG